MNLKVIEEVANSTKEFIKYLGLNINNPHHSNIISSVITEIFKKTKKNNKVEV